MQNNQMTDFRGYFPTLRTLNLKRNLLTAIPEGVYQLHQLIALNMSGNMPLSRNFTTAQAKFLWRLTWDLKEEDFVAFSGCSSSLDHIHGISVCISDNNEVSTRVGFSKTYGALLGRTEDKRKLYYYENYACPGWYSGGVLAGCIVGTVVFMLIVGALVWRWQVQKHNQDSSSYSRQP
ncbi:TKL protein kinase, partial [Phytophthora megakarya]